jgi:threonine dehydrogenase-like Zn-dependent dehydrogenase
MDEIKSRFQRLLERPAKHTLSIVVPQAGALPVVSTDPVEPLRAHEIRVMMVTMGYCGRDKSTVTGQKTAVPGRIGHEGAGIVLEKGQRVEHVEVGQNVIIFPFIRERNIGYDWPSGGKGIFSDLAVIPQEAVHPLQDGDLGPREWLALSLVEPFSGVSRGLQRADLGARDSLVILGAGPIGCAQAILAKYLRPAIEVILVDKSEEKLGLVKSRGVPADDFVATPGLAQAINGLAVRSGVPLIIHSNPDKGSLKQAIAVSPDKGTVLLFSGIYDWDEDDDRALGADVAIDPRAIHYEEHAPEDPVTLRLKDKTVTLIGSRGFTRDDFRASADLVVNKKIDPLPLVTNVLKFDANILRNLIIEGAKDSNLKLLMSPFDTLVNQDIARVKGNTP